MAIKFNFRKERIITDAQFYMFTEFVDIWKWDKAQGKKTANKLLYFVFLLCDLTEDNPLSEVDPLKKESEALFHAFGKKDYKFTSKELELVEPAIACYTKYNKTSEERILDAFDSKANQLRQTLEDTEPENEENINAGVTSFVSNTGIITKGLKELDLVKKHKMGVIAAVRNEAITQKVRGQMTLSPLSKGTIRLPNHAIQSV